VYSLKRPNRLSDSRQRAGGRPVAPEQRRAADLGELPERPARFSQQLVLPALGRQLLELAVDRAQIAHESVEPLLCLCELRAERLLVLGRFGVHGITWLRNGWLWESLYLSGDRRR